MRIGIAGGAGYTGGELIRLLLKHPQVELTAVSSETFAGKPLHAAHPNLEGACGLLFQKELDPGALDGIFLAGGHGRSMRSLPALLNKARPGIMIIDLSGDFRLKDPAQYPVWYGGPHRAPELLPEFTYGLTELNRKAIAGSRRIANPGCFATAIALALAPLAKAGLTGTAAVTAVTGSSGSGALAGPKTHHPARDGSLRAYKPLEHQHTPEIRQILEQTAGKESLIPAIVPISGPLVRGIYAVCHVDPGSTLSAAEVQQAYADLYQGCPFVRLKDAPPDLKAVTGSNFCDIHVSVKGRRIAAIAALDNLVKGAAGQAVQNLNVAMGWPESDGLNTPGLYP